MSGAFAVYITGPRGTKRVDGDEVGQLVGMSVLVPLRPNSEMRPSAHGKQ